MHFTLSALSSLHHTNGSPIILLHSPSSPATYSPRDYGAMISLSVLRASGARIPPRNVERAASRAGIHVRAGCMCNPGAASTLLGLASVLSGFQIDDEKHGHEHSRDSEVELGGHSPRPSSRSETKRKCRCSEDTPERVREVYARNENMQRLIEEEGVVRISFGLASSLADAARFVEFVREYAEAETGARYQHAAETDSRERTGSSSKKEAHAITLAQDLELDRVEVEDGGANVGCAGRRASTSAIPHWEGICKLAARFGRRMTL